MVKMIYPVLIGFLILANASIADLDNESIVYIAPSSSAFMQISSNPSTGYMWYVRPNASSKISVRDVQGTYTESQVSSKFIAGRSGFQTFEVICNHLCENGEVVELLLYKARSWEPNPVQLKSVSIIVTTNPHIESNFNEDNS
jgi:predicted secreted protein